MTHIAGPINRPDGVVHYTGACIINPDLHTSFSPPARRNDCASLSGVWGSSASNIYAVGQGYNSTTWLPIVYQYNGSSWTGSA